MSGRCFLSVKSIGADQSAAEVQSIQEIFERGDFVGFGRDFDLTADDFGLGIQGAEQLDRLAVYFGGGADAFAIDGQGADAQILEMRAKPATDNAVQFGRVQTLEHAADRAFAGSQEFAGFAAARGAQAAELVLIEGLGKFTDVDETVIAGNHGGRSNRDDGGNFSMTPAFVTTGIVQGLQLL